MKTTTHDRIKYDLLENAKDSLFHAVEHLTKKRLSTGDYKRVILDVSHAVELLLKERISRIHPAFIWRDIDKYNNPEAMTIGVEKAVNRLFKLEGIALSERAINIIRSCKKLRNSIEHYKFEIETNEARAIIGRVLSFIFTFSKTYLGIDLETEFRSDDRWSELINIYEFFAEHSKAAEQELQTRNISVMQCPSCGAWTFDELECRCIFCGHHDDLVECESCKSLCFESETEMVEEADEDVGQYCYTICHNCMKKEEAESMAMDIMLDCYRDK